MPKTRLQRVPHAVQGMRFRVVNSLIKVGRGGDCPPALPVPPALQKSNEIGEYGRVKTLSSSTIIYNKQAKPWSHRRPAAAASVAWPHGRWRPQAEAIESSGQGEEEWGEKEGRRKEEQTVAVLCLLSRGWPCYYYSTTLG